MLGNPGRISPRMIRLGLRGIAPPSANRPGCSASAQAAPAPHPLRDFALDGTPGSAEASDKGAPPPRRVRRVRAKERPQRAAGGGPGRRRWAPAGAGPPPIGGPQGLARARGFADAKVGYVDAPCESPMIHRGPGPQHRTDEFMSRKHPSRSALRTDDRKMRARQRIWTCVQESCLTLPAHDVMSVHHRLGCGSVLLLHFARPLLRRSRHFGSATTRGKRTPSRLVVNAGVPCAARDASLRAALTMSQAC